MGTAAEDRHFEHYTLKHRIVSWISSSLFDNFRYTVRHGLLKGMQRRGGLGWLPEWITGRNITPEEAFWRGLKLNGLVVYDVGAFVGLLTLFFARTAKHVVSYEPNAANRARLMENLGLNGVRSVTVRDAAVGEAPQESEMVWDPAMPGGASVEPETADHLRKTVPDVKAQSISVTTIDLDRAALNLPAPDLIKIDIEGWELAALRGARETIAACRPALYLEMHGETLREKKRKTAEIVRFLNEAGYDAIRHIETGELVTAANSDRACEGHLFAASRGNGR